MSTITLTVAGMTCEGCANSVRAELNQIPGVAEVDVNLSQGTVTISGDRPVDSAAVRAAVEEAGFVPAE